MNIDLINFLQLFDGPVQYSVPTWQRRYSWDKATIEQLIRDLETISKSDQENASHFGGTLITYSETTPAGTAQIFNVVDGQQRLTTISILLACIAEKLAETGPTEQWSSEKIIDIYLKNQLDPPRKLNLQDGDEEEYRRILKGCPEGEGKVTAAWKVLRSDVDSVGSDCLMKGLSRFKVISFTSEPYDDPQQIFESLNATGVPLTEGEKVKNWLLMGQDNKTQDQLYQDYWCKIEESLNALHEPKRIDEFLRDFLRWKTGDTYGISHTYTNLRQWWYKTEGAKDKNSLCEDLARLSGLYGKITGTNGHHENGEVDGLLRYLRGLRIDVHRPFTLRLLDDATRPDIAGANEEELVSVLRALSTWLTRIWLSGKSLAGLNHEFARFAHRSADHDTETYADYWIAEIKKLKNTGVAVPNDEEIRWGIRNRNAYGRKASDAARIIFWNLNSRLSNAADPSVEELSIEHIMPRKLSHEWREYLGSEADELHGKYLNSLANLTLVGKEFNSEISNQAFAKKRELYEESTFSFTRKLAQSYVSWREEDIERRVQELTDLVVECWPWENVSHAVARWRINQGNWQEEKYFGAILLNVIAEILDINLEENSKRLSGDRVSRDLFLSGMEPLTKGTRFASIPRHDQYVVNVGHSANAISKICREMGETCGVEVEIESLKQST